MKKILTLFSAALIFLCAMVFTRSLLFAQTFDFNKAYQDYLYQTGVYQAAFSAYQDSRDFYLKNQTLTLKEDARKKTLTMLKSRDQLIATYLTMLRMKLVETAGLSSDDKNNIFGKIDPEVKWYGDHIASYKDDDSLENLFAKSNESQDRYKSTTLPIIYESLFDAGFGEEVGIRQNQENIYSNLKDIINSGVAAGKLDLNPFNQWFSDIDNVINQLRNDEGKAKTQIQGVYGQTYSIAGSYSSATDTLTTSKTSLSELNNFLTEVLTSIRNQQKQ